MTTEEARDLVLQALGNLTPERIQVTAPVGTGSVAVLFTSGDRATITVTMQRATGGGPGE